MESDKRGKVLIVEDDQGTAVLHCNCLMRRGFDAISVATSHEAMQALDANDIQVIVLDYRLSDGTTGLQFCENLKAAGCSVPVVIVTGFSQEQTAVESLRAGVRDYVTKSPDYLDYLPEAVERISEQERARETIRLRDEQHHQTQRIEAVGTLAGGIAHEFNNLLQAIQGYATFAIQGLPPEEQRFQDLKQVLKAVDQASALTRQILGFGRRQPLNLADVDLNQLVFDLMAMIQPLIGSQINVAFAADDAIGLVQADCDQLRHVLINLCVNARDAMPQGGNLLLRTEQRRIAAEQQQAARPELQPGNYVVLSVRDDGCGISDAIKEHIFEPFFTAKEAGKNTGLGLAMAYGIVRQHGGTIQVKTAPARGSTFEVFLPLKARAAAAEPVADCVADFALRPEQRRDQWDALDRSSLRDAS